MLYCGEDVDEDRFDWKTKTLSTEKIQCEYPTYKELIEICSHPLVTTTVVTAFSRSICAFEFSTYRSQREIKLDGILFRNDATEIASIDSR